MKHSLRVFSSRIDHKLREEEILTLFRFVLAHPRCSILYTIYDVIFCIMCTYMYNVTYHLFYPYT